ncbi:hypothetical protein ACGF12_14020 [Kitasatospora sp. NPDC048296]|uniref:hypothetical protein n=1 Tax=Kitasatospora sp. NPDC048296 TaxID=3364048 RepID=UPI00371420B6
MRKRAWALAAAVMLAAVPSAALAQNRSSQSIGLDASAGDGSVWGNARLTATQENNGYRLKGWVESGAGCVELKAVNMHLGSYLGGDQIVKTCETNVQVPVNAWTHHTDVVLSAIVPHGQDWDSHIVTLTGR